MADDPGDSFHRGKHLTLACLLEKKKNGLMKQKQVNNAASRFFLPPNVGVDEEYWLKSRGRYYACTSSAH
jgi:hypothetical protein